MPKIRDLGINVIPATMRPPEIGQGGGYQMADPCPCADPSGSFDSAHCPPPPPQCLGSVPPPKCEPGSGQPPGGGKGPDKGGGKGGLNPEDITQLQQQMRGRIGVQF